MLQCCLLVLVLVLPFTHALTGRFMHITDLHPDPWYTPGAKISNGCHDHGDVNTSNYNYTGQGEDKGSKAHYWGEPVSSCDSSMTFINTTFDWLREYWRNELDFVIWTGDSARHDLDSSHPRTLDEIVLSNKNMSQQMHDALGDVPIIASIGNNDVWPHNVMWGGPTQLTLKMADAWKYFIPEEQYHTFATGGYYSREVIPDKLVVVALNTQYFFNKNMVVNGCPRSKKPKNREPGSEELIWLESQLKQWRKRGMQVWLSGHVPPAPGRWYEDCYQWYGEIALSFQDTILGHFFGHMNADHFFWFDAEHVLYEDKDTEVTASNSSCTSLEPLDTDNVDILGSKEAMTKDLQGYYKSISKIPKLRPKDFATVNVAPSVIPTYYPAVRVWNFNASIPDDESMLFRQMANKKEEEDHDVDDEVCVMEGSNMECCSEVDLEIEREVTVYEESDEEEEPIDTVSEIGPMMLDEKDTSQLFPLQLDLSNCGLEDEVESFEPLKKKKRKHRRRKKKPGKGKKKKDRLPRHASKNSPSRTNTFLTPLMYTQFYVDLRNANKHKGWGSNEKVKNGTRPPPTWEIEYVTCDAATVERFMMSPKDTDSIPNPFPQKMLKELQKTLTKSKIKELTPYGMPDMTINEWLKLSSKVTETEKKWKEFVTRIFVQSGVEDTW